MTAPKIALIWENFGPSHFDRIGACVAAGYEVAAIEFFAASEVYKWEDGDVPGAERITLFQLGERVTTLKLAWRLLKTLRSKRFNGIFLCHYQNPAVFLVACVLRLLGPPAFTMIDSKFDDYPRFLRRELGKAIMLAPYRGALAGSGRTAAYLHFLGFHRRPVLPGFDTLDLTRIRQLAGMASPPPHAQRDFLIVARLVPKKNLEFAIRAYAEWRRTAMHPRKLRIIGYGALEVHLRSLVRDIGLDGHVLLEGAAESAAVCRAMRDALCLILPSVEEQFGLVVIEAMALGLPVLLSCNAGAVDELLDNGVNGWIVDPYRPAALINAMALLDRDETTWQAASAAASAASERGDVRHFVASVAKLTSGTA